MDLKHVVKSTAKTLSSYLTYQAVRMVVDQLSETNPPLSMWLSKFSSTGKIQDGEAYIQELLQANQELAFRVMTVRDYLAIEVTDFLPELVRTNIQQANMEHRRQHLERITQLHLSDPIPSLEEVPEAEAEAEADGKPPAD